VPEISFNDQGMLIGLALDLPSCPSNPSVAGYISLVGKVGVIFDCCPTPEGGMYLPLAFSADTDWMRDGSLVVPADVDLDHGPHKHVKIQASEGGLPMSGVYLKPLAALSQPTTIAHPAHS